MSPAYALGPGSLRFTWGPKDPWVRPWLIGLGWTVSAPGLPLPADRPPSMPGCWAFDFEWRYDGRAPVLTLMAHRDVAGHNLPNDLRAALTLRLTQTGLATWVEGQSFAPGGVPVVATGTALRPAELEVFAGRGHWPAHVGLRLRLEALVDFTWGQSGAEPPRLDVYLPDPDPITTLAAKEVARGMDSAAALAFARESYASHPQPGDNRLSEPVTLSGTQVTAGPVLRQLYGSSAPFLAHEAATIGDAATRWAPGTLTRFTTALSA